MPFDSRASRPLLRPKTAPADRRSFISRLQTAILFWRPAINRFGLGAREPVHLVVPALAGRAVLVVVEPLKPVRRWPLGRAKMRRTAVVAS